MPLLICAGHALLDWPVLLNNASEYLLEEKMNKRLEQLNLEVIEEFSPGIDLPEELLPPHPRYLVRGKKHLAELNPDAIKLWLSDSVIPNLAFWGSVDETSKFLLFFCRPEEILRNYLANHNYRTQELGLCLDRWYVRAQMMLEFYFKHRERVTLVEYEAANETPAALSGLLKKNYAIAVNEDSNRTQQSGYGCLEEFVLLSILQSRPELERVSQELLVAATLANSGERAFHVGAVRSLSLIDECLSEIREYRLQQESGQKFGEEKSLLLSRQKVIEAELTALVEQVPELEDELKGRQKEITLLKSQRSMLEGEMEFYFNQQIKTEGLLKQKTTDCISLVACIEAEAKTQADLKRRLEAEAKTQADLKRRLEAEAKTRNGIKSRLETSVGVNRALSAHLESDPLLRIVRLSRESL